MKKPKRLQRKRTKGWRKPEEAVVVDRTSRWGNPFKIEADHIVCDASHRRKVMAKWVWFDGCYAKGELQVYVVNLYRAWIYNEIVDKKKVRPCPFTIDDIKHELAGKDLMCFCSLDHPCHADVLLELANT